jgi:hypothetical protein
MHPTATPAAAWSGVLSGLAGVEAGLNELAACRRELRRCNGQIQQRGQQSWSQIGGRPSNEIRTRLRKLQPTYDGVMRPI